MNNPNSVSPSDFGRAEEPTNNSNAPKERERCESETDSFLKKQLKQAQGGRRRSLREPITHLKNKTFFEVVFGACFEDFGTQLTIEELVPFYDLKDDANTYFDNKCPDYDEILRDMWLVLKGERLEEVENDGWKSYGFQNRNPRSDFRGGGLLSLKQLVYFVKSNKEKALEMSQKNEEFLFAVSSINITYFLIKYYHLSNNLIFSKDKKEICSRVALKTFCSMLRVDQNVLNKIHGLLLEDLYGVWGDIKKKVPGLTLMDFNMALNLVKSKFVRLTKSNSFDSFSQLKSFYTKLETVLPTRKASFSKK